MRETAKDGLAVDALYLADERPLLERLLDETLDDIPRLDRDDDDRDQETGIFFELRLRPVPA